MPTHLKGEIERERNILRNMKKRLFGILMSLALILGITGYAAENPEPGYIDVSPKVANALIGSIPDLVIIDVSPMFAKGHIPGAVNYYVGDGTLDTAIPTLDKTRTYLVYCHTDSASISGATKLVEAGIDQVFRLDGNYSAWVEAGYPAAAYVDVSPKAANALIGSIPDLVIIDVSPMYDKGHLPGAVNYFVGDGTLEAAIPTLDKAVTYLVYCHTDSASIAGATMLIEAGIDKVFRLEGNFSAWVDAGYPVE